MKNKMNAGIFFRNAVILAAAILMLNAGSVSANAATAADLDDSYSGKTVILQSNDVHGALEGYQYIAGLRDELVKRGADVVIVDSGDFIQGSSYVAESKGFTAIKMMNECGYEYITVGNHEFDFDTIRLLRNLGKLNAAVLVSNLIDNKAHERAFDPSALYSSADSDLKIGFYGESTPHALTLSLPGNLQGVEFIHDEQEMYRTAREDIDELEETGADVIICLSHLGIDNTSSPYVSYNLYENTKNSIGTGSEPLTENSIKEKYIILDGHSHTVMEHGSNGEPIMQTGTKFMNIGVVVIDEKTEKIEKNFLYRLRETDSESAKFLEGLYSNKSVKDLSAEIEAEFDRKYSEKIGETAVELNGVRGSYNKDTGEIVRGNRNSETNMGDLICDAFRWYGLKYGKSLDLDPEKTVVIQNGGAIRDGISKGDITKKDIINVMPFDNTINIISVKGSKLLEALEAATYSSPDSCGGFPQVSGMELVIDEGAEYDPQDEPYPDSAYHGPKTIRRVTIKSVNGKPFDKNETYTVLANNFVAAGGDTYYAFASADRIIDTGIIDADVLSHYLAEKLGGVVDKEYAEAQGRIKIVRKSNQSLKLSLTSAGARTVRASGLRKSAKSVKAVKVSGAKGTVTYKKQSGSKKLSINKKTGKVKIKKGTGKGTYKIKIKVIAAATDDYRSAEKTKTVKITVSQ